MLIGLGLSDGVLGALAGLAGTVLLAAIAAAVGLVRPIKVRSATYRNSDAGTTVTAVVKNHKLKAERELSGLLLTLVPAWPGRMKARLRHPWAWPRNLPSSDAHYILVGDDMGRILSHALKLNARNELTVRAEVVDRQKHQLPAGASLPKNLWLIAYCGSEAPSPKPLQASH
jgi:hypothetical protein